MTKAQRNVLSGTLFVLGAIGALLFAAGVWFRVVHGDVSVRGSTLALLVIMVGIPTVVLFGAAFYVRAGQTDSRERG